ncbi:MAG: hypothetical protein NTU44_06525, partial [Bacteroidetes bacterium]|nr:hypothetical protein [Bacteroidota bacterium]
MKTTITKVAAVCMTVILTSFAFISKSQSITTTAPTLSVCPGTTTVSIPITVENLANVASISLTMNYNQAVLSNFAYTTNPALGGGFTVANAVGGQVKAAWFGLSPITITGTATLFTFTFTYLGGSSALTWDLVNEGNCQYSDLLGLPYPNTVWINGALSAVGALSISAPPLPVTVEAGIPASFTIGAENATGYQWEELPNGSSTWGALTETPPYSGVQSATLVIDPTILGYSGNQYRCVLTAPCSQTQTSTAATLTVNVPCIDPTAYQVGGGGDICPGSSTTVTLSNSEEGVTYTLYLNGAETPNNQSGSGNPLEFGNINTPGIYTIYGTNVCGTVQMTGSVVVSFLSLPAAFTLTGGGSYCYGGSGLPLVLAGSENGIEYNLYINSSLQTTITGNGSPIDFGNQTVAGNYEVIATNGCGQTSQGTVTITIIPLPGTFSVTGGGTICQGASTTVLVDNSEAGVNYVLFNGPISTGMSLPGSGSGIVFAGLTDAGTYTVVGSNSCGTQLMNGEAVIDVIPGPEVFTVTGSSNYCSGAMVQVGLNGSTAELEYKLYLDGAYFGMAVTGTGSSIGFDVTGQPGEFAIKAVTSCGEYSMGGSASFTLIQPAVVYNVVHTGSSTLCHGQAGVTIGLDGSDAGVSYDLINSGTVVITVDGTGTALTFGTYIDPGTYTVVASNLCGPVNMGGGVDIIVNPLPSVYTVTGGGNICPGAPGHVYLSGSQTGILYTLQLDGIFDGTFTGTGDIIDFGDLTSEGTYTVIAADAVSGCVSPMEGSATLVLFPLLSFTSSPVNSSILTGENTTFEASVNIPADLLWVYSIDGGTTFNPVTEGGVCSGVTTPTLTITSATLDMNGYLYRLTAAESTCSQNIYSDYAMLTVTAPIYVVTSAPLIDDAIVGNTVVVPISVVDMHDAAAISLTFNYTPGILTYQGTQDLNPALSEGFTLSNGTVDGKVTFGWFNVVPVTILSGTLTAFTFVFNGGYTDLTWDITTPGVCQYSNLAATTLYATFVNGHVTGVCPLPVAYNVTGTGSYCAGIEGLAVGLDGSQTSTTYELYNNSVSTGIFADGTGDALTFGVQPAGSYTVVATNACGTADMTGNAVITQNELPVVTLDALTNVCADGGAVALNGLPAGGVYSGDGLDNGFFYPGVAGVGTHTITYSYTDINGCSGSADQSITVFELPAVFTVTGGGNNCPANAPHIFLSGSQTGVVYTLNNDGVLQFNLPGTGDAIDFGALSSPGNYTILATSSEGCQSLMDGSATIIPITVLYFSNDPSDFTVLTGSDATFTAYTNMPADLIWQVSIDGGSSYSDLTEGGVYSGTTTTTLSITGATIDMNDYYYRCMASDPVCGQLAYSGAALLTVTTPLYIITTAPSIDDAISGNEVIVPIQVENMNEVAALSLTLEYLPGVITYTGYQNADPALSTGFFMVNGGTDGKVVMGWFNIIPITIADGPLIEFTFTFNGGYTPLSWNLTEAGACQYTDILAVTLNATYVDGHVTGVCPLPLAFNVTGTGSYCTGVEGLAVGLDGSQVSTTYELFNNSVSTGIFADGTGNALSFGILSAGSYTVIATNACGTSDMTGTALITENALPFVSLDPLNNVCVDAGAIALVGTPEGGTYSGDGVDNGFFYPGVAGVGTHSITYSYSDINGCSASAVQDITVLVIPSTFTVTGGGNNCPGNPAHVYLSGSETDVLYSLYYNGTYEYAIWGSGDALDFGSYTGIGSYTVTATTVAGCNALMDGSVSISAYPVLGFSSNPSDFTVLAGNNASFTANASMPSTLVWQVSTDGGSSYSDLSNSGIYSGVNTSTLTITGATTDINGYYFRCMATEAVCGQVAYSGVALLTVTTPLYIITTAPSIDDAVPGNEVIIPIQVENMNNVAAISLTLEYVPGVITYTGYQNLNPALTAGFSMVNGGTDGKVVLGWFNIVPISVATGTLVDFKFTFNGGYTPLSWNLAEAGACQYSDILAVILDATFVDGHVTGICPLPLVYNVTGTGSYCTGGEGIAVGLDGSQVSTTYELFNDNVSTGIFADGTGNVLSFGTQAAGSFTVVATNGCGNSDMTGNAVITENSLPFVTLDPIASVCVTGASVNLTASPAGGLFSGPGVELSLFSPLLAGEGDHIITYTYTDGNGCTNSDSKTVTVNGLPNVSLDPVAPLCVDAVEVALNGSPVGGVFSGSGVDNGFFYPGVAGVGTHTITYSYTDINGCSSSAAQDITVLAIPSTFTVTGGGNNCPGNPAYVYLSGSESGVLYSIYYDGIFEYSLWGSGDALDFGSYTGIGNYTVTAITAAGCNALMDGSASITAYPVLGFSSNPTDVTILTGENASFGASTTMPATLIWQVSTDGGANYSDLTNSGVYSGVSTSTLNITGATIDMNGYYYRSMATETVCGQVAYSGVALLTVTTPLYIITTAPSIDNAVSGNQVIVPIHVENMNNVAAISLTLEYVPGVITYQGYQNLSPAIGAGFSMVNGGTDGKVVLGWFNIVPTSITDGILAEFLFTFNGGYTPLSWNLTEAGACQYSDIMAVVLDATFVDGHVTGICPLPLVYNVTGTGSYCAGGEGLAVGLDGSQVSTTYELFNNNASTGLFADGTGNAISFGTQPAGSYTVAATNSCGTSDMTGNALLTENALPVVTLDPIASVCITAASVTLTASPAGGFFSGPGVELSLFTPYLAGEGVHTITYTYTDGNGCTNSDSKTVTVYGLPIVTLDAVAPLCVDASPVTLNGSPAGGVYGGLGIDNGIFNPGVAGVGTHTITYSYSDINGCSASASQDITVMAIPSTFTVTGGGNNCPGNPAHIYLSGSETFVLYTLYYNGTYELAIYGTGDVLDFGTFTGIGNYTVTASTVAGCDALMDGSASITAYPILGFSSNPTDVSILTGENASFFASATMPATLFWQLSTDGGANYTDLANSGVYSGVNTSTLSITAATADMNGYYYRCVATEAVCGQVAFSTVALLTVTTPLAIITTAPSIDNAVYGNTVIVPITVENLNNVAAISLTLEYIPGILTYEGYQNLNSALTAGFSMVNGGTDGKVVLGWFNIAPISIGAGTLVEFKFTFNGGYTPLSWNLAEAGACQYSDIMAVVLDATFVDGHVTGLCDMPIVFNVSGGGSYCTGSAGVSVGLDGSENNANYELFNNSVSTGLILSGTGDVLDFGFQAAGNYTVVATNSCGPIPMNGNANIVVNPLPVVTLNPIASVCVTGNSVTLTGSPAGGTFSGPGVELGLFSPYLAGEGVHTITYTYTDGNGCTNSDSKTVTVYGLPLVTLDAIAPLCIDALPLALNGTPAGGVYSGDGVDNGTFDPAVAGVGIFTITYNYTDGNGCSASATQDITVNGLPVVTLDAVAPLCIDALPVALNGAPAGGVYSGDGVAGNIFSPAVAGVGIFTITYNYTDGNGCSASATQDITVNG